MSSVVYINGTLVPTDEARVSVFDHGLLYGDGVFEGIRVYGGRSFLLDEHMDRISRSASYFCRTLDEQLVRAALDREAQGFGDAPMRVRVTVSADARISVESTVLDESQPGVRRRVRLAVGPHDVASPFAYHKTTVRDAYVDARNSGGDCDDVILWNSRREITESTIANVVVEVDGRKITPPVRCGLLAGTFRRHLLESGQVEEVEITIEELSRADRVYLVNSVRGWMEAELIGN